MFNVSNKRVINRLAMKSYRDNKRRNITAICAITLTTILFCVIFTLGLSMVKSMEYNSMRMSGGMAHGTFKYLSEEKYEKIKNHPSIQKIGRAFFVGRVKNEELIKRITEVDCYDEITAEMGFIDMVKGRLPEKENEVALDTVTLDLLGIEHKAGAGISLDIDFDDRVETYDFILSGFFEGDAGFQGSFAFVSEAFVKKELAGRGQQEYKDGDSHGSIRADVMFADSKNIEQRMREVITDSGYKPENEEEFPDEYTIKYGVNWAYLNSNMDNNGATAFLVIICSSLLIGLTGYLIIYNIFQISVIRDIRFYGLLKTIGTTGKQTRAILVRQALFMCLFGIPAGLILGFLLGVLLLPLITVLLNGGKNYVSANPLIFMGSAAFSILTVFISCLKPARAASRISPVEAVKASGVDRSYKKKHKRSTDGAKLYKMAFSNLGRNRKRTVIVVISMSLALILTNAVFTLSNGLDMDKFVERFIDVDFQVSHAAYFNLDYIGNGNDSVSPQLVASLEKLEKFQDGGGIYTSDCFLQAEYMGSLTNKWTRATTEYNETNGVQTQIYGMDDFCLNHLDIVKGECNLEKLKSGKGVLLGLLDDDYGNMDFESALYEIGEKIKLKEVLSFESDENIYDDNGNVIDTTYKFTYGNSKEYEVLGYYRLTYSNTTRRYGDFATIAMASDELRSWKEDVSQMTYLCEAKDEAGTKQIEDFLASYTKQEEPLMSYVSRASYQAEFDQLRLMLVGVGGALCLIIGIIGILNFINAISTGILARQREFAILKSIGMTTKQLKRMLILEGVYYAVMTMAVSLIGSILFSYGVLSHMNEFLWLLNFRPTFAALFIAAPFLIVLAVFLPMIFYHGNVRESIVEKLKQID